MGELLCGALIAAAAFFAGLYFKSDDSAKSAYKKEYSGINGLFEARKR